MLALTANAAHAVETIISQPGLPDEAGVRISASATNQNGAGTSRDLELTVVESPEPGDELIHGTSIYVDSRTAPYLADKVLDAEVDERQVRFSLHEQDVE